MYRLGDGAVLPGIGIGMLSLGITYNEIQEISNDFTVDDRLNTFVLMGEDVQIWIDKETGKASQIMVLGSFQGKYAGQIGIGSKLPEVLAMGKTYHEDLDTYVLDNEPGMCFVLGDTPEDDDWDELRAPIEYISVFVPRPDELLR